jgi:hypothetical protein
MAGNIRSLFSHAASIAKLVPGAVKGGAFAGASPLPLVGGLAGGMIGGVQGALSTDSGSSFERYISNMAEGAVGGAVLGGSLGVAGAIGAQKGLRALLRGENLSKISSLYGASAGKGLNERFVSALRSGGGKALNTVTETMGGLNESFLNLIKNPRQTYDSFVKGVTGPMGKYSETADKFLRSGWGKTAIGAGVVGGAAGSYYTLKSLFSAPPPNTTQLSSPEMQARLQASYARGGEAYDARKLHNAIFQI